MSYYRELYHISPVLNTASTLEDGLLVSERRTRAACIWLVSASRVPYAIRHVQRRHGVTEVAVFQVRVRRGLLRRQRRGVWRHYGDVPPARVAALLVVGGAR